MRIVSMVVVLLAAFELGRLLPIGAGEPTVSRATALAQPLPPPIVDCSTFPDPSAPEAVECRVTQLSDRIARASNDKLEAGVAARSDAFRQFLLGLIQQGQAQLADEIRRAQDVKNRSEDLNEESRDLNDRARDLNERSRDALDQQEELEADMADVFAELTPLVRQLLRERLRARLEGLEGRVEGLLDRVEGGNREALADRLEALRDRLEGVDRDRLARILEVLRGIQDALPSARPL